MFKQSILHIRDADECCDGVQAPLRSIVEPAEVELVNSEASPRAIELARHGSFDVIIVEAKRMGSTDIEIVGELISIAADVPIIVILRGGLLHSELGEYEEKIFELISLPVNPRVLRNAIGHALEKSRLVREVRRLRSQSKINVPSPRENGINGGFQSIALQSPEKVLVGKSEAIAEVRRKIVEVANSDITVLLLGETGTGKGVAAQLIHELSSRAVAGTFIKINCPSIPEPLMESEIFGHETGAFTGAQKRKPGRLEMAGGGTVFLDEIGDIPLSAQSKLLQVFERKEFTRLGGKRLIRVDARILAATNARLENMIKTNEFRGDLYYRISQYTIHLPPLRNRIEDVPILANHFLEKSAPIYGNCGLSISEQMMSQLVRYSWPGNVRELESAVRRYALTGEEDAFDSSKSGEQVSESTVRGSPRKYREVERSVILAALAETRWNRRQAAKIIGMSYNTLRRRIARYDLDVEPHPTEGEYSAAVKFDASAPAAESWPRNPK